MNVESYRGRDGLIHFWQRLGGGDHPLWTLATATDVRQSVREGCVTLLVAYLSGHEWVNVDARDIVTN